MMNQRVHSFWFGSILFLPDQSNIMDHSCVVAMSHICKNKEPCLYAHKKLANRFPGLLIPDQVNENVFFFHICILRIVLYKLALPKYSIAVNGFSTYINPIAFVSQGHKDFDHNGNNFIYSKAILLTGK